MPRFCTASLLAALATLMLAPGPLAAAPSQTHPAIPRAAVIPDPRIGPNAADEARHAGQAVALAPATSTPIPLSHLSLYASSPSLLAPSTTPFHREVFGFAPYWALNQNSTWNYRLLTTLTYFGLTLNRDGVIDTTVSGYSEWSSQDLVTIINNAHAAGDKVLVTVKQFQTEAINRVVTDPALTNVAIGNIMNAIAAKNLDGVNIDFEGQTSATYPYLQSGLTTFMTQLSQTVHARWPNAEVTIDTYTGAASWDGGLFNITNLAPVVDAFFIMAYDMPFDDYVGHAAANAPMTNFLYNDTLAVQQYMSKAPASKIILGVPYYGYKWSVTGNGPNAPVTSGATADNYANIVQEIACHPQYMTANWDSLAESPWLAWYSPASNDPCDGNFGSWRELYYDNATSLGLKYDLVNQNNLRGAGMWALGYDGGATELWNEIAQKLTTTTVWDTLNGLTNADPTIGSSSTTRLDAVIRGTDNALWQNTWNGTTWSGFNSLGGYLTSRPSAVEPAASRIDVFARGEDYALWHRRWDGTTWQPWESLGGNLTSGPSSATWSTSRLDVFVRGSDNALWHRSWDGTAWHAWDSVGGVLTSDPASVAWGNGRLDVFVKGADNALWHRAYELGGWGDWQSLGGSLISAPGVASCGTLRLDVYAVGVDRAMWRRSYSPNAGTGAGTAGSQGWSDWQSMGGQWAGGPAAACETGSSVVDILERAQDGGVWHTAVTAP